MTIILYLFKFHLVIIYFFIKLIFRQKKQVFFLSRQFDNISLNYQMVIDELEKKNIKYKCICKKVDNSINDSVRTHGNYSNTNSFIKKITKNINSSFSYYFSLYRQMKAISQSKVIIVDGYNLPVSMLKHKKNTKVIQMWHALGAIKQFGYQAIGKKDGINPKIAKILKMHANYDYILSGSTEMNKFFSEAFNTNIDKVLAIGTPTVDYLKQKNPKIEKEIFKKYPIMKKKINVLYSPTFRNDKTNNLQELIDNFDFNKCNLIITFHPKVDNVSLDNRVICVDRKEFDTFDILKTCDYVITDYSALMIDSAIVNKKILLYVYDYEKYKEENGLNIELLKDFKNITSKDAKELVNIIINNKYDMKEYKKFQKMYTPSIKGRCTDEVTNIIMRCLNEK
jgi:CDP-ribitol ribitolphosphotransferase